MLEDGEKWRVVQPPGSLPLARLSPLNSGYGWGSSEKVFLLGPTPGGPLCEFLLHRRPLC